ncbi:hypothetical protein B0H10DRAFT_2077263, partial [Mycena sp. CBHHK59/15]
VTSIVLHIFVITTILLSGANLLPTQEDVEMAMKVLLNSTEGTWVAEVNVTLELSGNKSTPLHATTADVSRQFQSTTEAATSTLGGENTRRSGSAFSMTGESGMVTPIETSSFGSTSRSVETSNPGASAATTETSVPANESQVSSLMGGSSMVTGSRSAIESSSFGSPLPPTGGGLMSKSASAATSAQTSITGPATGKTANASSSLLEGSSAVTAQPASSTCPPCICQSSTG